MRQPVRLVLTLLGLIALVVLAGVPANAGAPTVRIHGTETWTPVMEVALDEVAMLWAGQPRQQKTPPALVDGASVLRVSRDAAAIRLKGVTDVADLVARAHALREANPSWETRLVLYTAGQKRNARSRRLLTDEIAVVAKDGSVTREHVTDPLRTLLVAQTIAQREGVTSAEPVAQASDYLQARLKRKIAKLQRQDQPSERQEFFALKRVPQGESVVPTERYVQARDQMRQMPLHSTAGGSALHPSAAELGMNFDTAASFLGAWTPLGPGNIGGRTRSIVIDPATPSTMYAGGVAGGVWKTVNSGASWTPLTDTLLPNLAIASLDMDPTNNQVLYAGTGEGVFNGDAVRGAGIFKTTDAGASWSQLAATAPPGSTDFLFVNKIKVLANGTTVLAATRTGLWRSQNSGTSWTQVINAAAVSGCFDIAVAPPAAPTPYILASCGTFAQGTVHRSASNDATAAFTPVLGPSGSSLSVPDMGRTSIAIAASNPTIAYALASSTASGLFNLGLKGVYKSTDSGVTWSPTITNTNPTPLNTLLLTNPVFATPACFGFNSFFNQGWYDNVIAVDPTNASRIWTGGIDLFRSDDGGLNFALASFWWTGASPGPFAHADQHTIVFHPNYNGGSNQTMFVGNDGGIFKTTNATGSTTTDVCDPTGVAVVWTELNNNYGVTQFYHGLPFPGPNGGDTFFGGAQDNGTILGTTAGGIDGWGAIMGGDGGYVAVDSANPMVLYAETTGLSISKSIDGGSNFDDATGGITNSGFLFITPFTMSPNNSQNLWIGGDRMWRTTNATASWSQASQTFGCGSVSAIAVAPNNGAPGGIGDNLVMAGTSSGCVFRTTVGLTSSAATPWTQISTAGSGYVSWIGFDPSDANNVYVTHSTFGVGHVFKSIDAGVTFTNIDGSGSTGIPDVPTHTVAVAPGNPSKIYVGTDLGVFSSDDGGATWAVENTGFANVITEALTLGQVGGVDHLFAFTHGRGVFRVALPPSVADIATTVATVPTGTSTAPGATINVSNTVKNVGGQPTSTAFVVGFALVPVDGAGNPSGSDIPLGVTRAAGPLGANITSAATTPVMLPTDAAAGSYKIKVIGDLFGLITEDPNPSNNNKLTNSFVIAIPDLTVNSVTFTPAASGAGMNVSFTHTLRNVAVSPGNAPASVSGIYLATNASFSTVITQLGTVNAPAVNANTTSAAITKSLQIPPVGVVPPGRYFVLVQANDDNGFVEASTANNVGASSTQLILGPDLLVTTGSTGTGASPGTNVSATYTVKNQGGVAATFNVGFALVPVNASGTPTGADIPVGPTSSAIMLSAGATSAALTSNVFLPPDFGAGLYKMRFIADPANVVAEADETNNTFLSTVILNVVRPDLTVTSVTFTPAASKANGSVSVTHIVKNLSPAPGTAPASISSLFLSGVNNSVVGAVPLGNVNVGSLLGTASATVVKSATIPPATPPGLYFVLAQADAPDAIVEPNESNNLGSSTTRLIVGPDISFTAGSAGTGVAPGTNLSVMYTLKNGGGDATGSFVVGFTLVPVSPSGADIPLTFTRTVTNLAAGGTPQAFTDSVPIPSDTGGGTYKVRITADTTNAVTEADETNNTFLTGNVLVARADLTVSSVTFTPATTKANGSVSISHVLKNLTAPPGAAAPSVSSLFLNSVNNSVVGGIFLGNVSAPSILGSAMATVTQPSALIPPATAPGLYFVLAQADAGNALLEPNENNNLGTSTTRLIVGPDLSITTGTTATPGIAPGTNLSVTYTLKNGGGEAANNFAVSFTLVPVSPAGPDIPVGPTQTAVTVAAGATKMLTNNVLIPSTTGAGTYKVRITADSTNAVTEADETNNTFLTANVTVARADLTVSSVTFTPATTRANGSVSISHVLKNLSAAPGTAAPTVSSLFLNSVNNSVVGGIFLGNVSAPSIVGAGMATVTTPGIVIPLGTPPGLYFVLAQADAAGTLLEPNEGNNLGTSVTRLVVGPDLTVTAATTAAGGSAGMNLSVMYTLKNAGGDLAAGFDVGFALVPVTAAGVPTGDPDIPIGPTRTALTLGAGLVQSLTSNVLVPAGTVAGNYKVRVIADPSNAIVEASETNNSLLTGLVKIGRPDLTVPSVTFTPAAVATGGAVSVTHTVKNVTTVNGNAPASQSAIYLSQNASFAGVLTQLGTVSVPPLASNVASAALVKSVNVGNLSTGLYFFAVRADDPDAIIEQNEGNNVGISATGLIVGPDASVAAATTAVTGAGPGTNVSVAYTLKNLGVAPTATFNVGFDVTPVNAAGAPIAVSIPLGTVDSNVSLAASGMQSFTRNALLPPDLAAGTYRIGVTVFGFSGPDANPANDTLLTAGILTVFRPDLVVNSVTVTPTAVAVGGNVSATHVVRNATATIGNAPASFSSVFLSTNASVAGVFFTYPLNVSVPALLPGAMSTPITTVLPLGPSGPNLAPGKYFVGFMADAPGLIFEANEGNNVLFAATPVLVGPDPAVTAVSLAPTSVAPGTNVSVTRTLTNLGATATGAFDVDYVLEPLDPASPIPDVTLLRVHELSLGPVGSAGATRSGTVALTIPPGTAPGQYKILVVVDPDGTLPEADETNNVGVTTTLNVVRADLVMSVFTPPTTLIAGRSVSLTNTVKNNATAPGAAGPFGVGVYFSNTSTPDTTGDTLVGNRSLTGLAGGATSALPVTITVPNTSGSFFLKAFADFTDVVVEANESNNVTVKPVTVVPDLAAGRTNVTASITFNIGGSPPVCLASITGSGNALETITTQTGASFSGGKLTFFDSAGGSDTITFTGTVAPAGNVSGTFTLSRVGGGGGSGSGSFTGTSGLGTPGSLVLDFTGTFTVAGGGTCTATAQVIFGTGSLVGQSVVPASLTAGAGGNVDVSFSTGNSWPFNGALQIAFPSGFDLSSVNFAGVTGPSGSFVTSVAGQTVTLQRFGGSTYSPGPVSITLSGVRNPVDSGTTGTFQLTTTNGSSTPIDTGTAPGVTLTAGTLTGASVVPASLVASATGNVDVSFFTAESWPADGMLRVDFPSGFDVSGASFFGASGPNGTFSVGVSGQTVTVTRSGGSTFAGNATITLGTIQNPATTGTTGTFSLATTTSTGGVIDTGTAPGVDITP